MKLLMLLMFLGMNAFAQITCIPNTDFCFPENETGNVVVVPSTTFPNIQSAVSQVPPGTTVRIKGGTYYENVTIDRNITLVGNSSPGKPTIINPLNNQEPIFRLNGGPAVNFRNMRIQNSSHGIYRDLQQPEPLPSVKTRNMTLANLGRGIFGSFNTVETNDVLIDQGTNGISLGSIQNLKIRRTVVRLMTGYGLIVIGSPGSTVLVSHVTVHDNLKGGMFIVGIDSRVDLNFVIARDNGVAGIILEKTGLVNVSNSDMFTNRMASGKFGNGLLNYSSPVLIENSNVEHNQGFALAAVGCGTPSTDRFTMALKNNEIISPYATAIAMYAYPECTDPSVGSLRDEGGNRCVGFPSCGAQSAGGLSPIPKEL